MLARRVADGPQQVGRAQHRAGHRVRPPRAPGELRGHRADPGERPPRRGERQAQRERAARALAQPDQPERHQHADEQARQAGHRDGGGERRVPPGHRGADQLPPAGLLLGPRVPGDQEHRHQAGEQRAEHAPPPHQEAADGGGVVDRAEHGQERGVRARRRAELPPQLLRAVQLAQARRGGQRDADQPDHPDRQQQPVAPQREAHQGAGPDQGAHGRTAS
ncbi:hypothetical protein J7S33_02025 [Saccharothrix algeriensis]|uniref:Uncharacterized protein n=1 Tax=Saccharothrix algeriensis TaxID=173560 RepID=A0A8T8HZI7_9PSEU|nr:hypothetical protein J7S33_02025 [Saccharothrix algeriensis]